MEKYDNMKQEIQELQVRLRDSEDARKTAERFASEAQDLVEAAEKRADQANEESADAFRRMRVWRRNCAPSCESSPLCSVGG